MLDTPSLGALANCSSQLFACTKSIRIRRFFNAMREGDIQRVKQALDAFDITNDNSQERLISLLTFRCKMSWSTREDKNGERQTLEYQDTPLQLAWRMQHYKMYDLIKARLDEIDPTLAVKQITEDFQVEQSDCVDEYVDTLQALLDALANQQRSEARKRWCEGAGQVVLRTWRDMSHVIHWQCSEGSGFWEKDFDKPFEFSASEVVIKLRSTGAGDAGRAWHVVFPCVLEVEPARDVFAYLKSKLAEDRNARLSQLSSVKQEEPILPNRIFDRY